MDTHIKNYVGIALIITLVLMALSAVGYVRSYSKATEPTAFRSFAVSAEGKVVAVPDVATFTFSVLTEGGNDLAALQKTNTEKLNKAITYVKEQGVADKDIRTNSYDIQPRYQYYNCPPDRATVCPPAQIVGYTINQSVEVKVRDFTKVGDLLSGVVKNGANTVSQMQFTLDDPMKAEAQAKGEAIKRAREQAEIIAKEGGFRIGKLLSVEDGTQPPIPLYESYGRGGALDASVKEMDIANTAPAIEPGSHEVIVTVTLRYEIR